MSLHSAVITDNVFPNLEPAKKILAEFGAELRIADKPTVESIVEKAHDADALLVTYAEITAEIIQQLPKCKVITRFGIGVDNIDIEAASQAGIVVTYVPDYCVDEVSDHALALLLNMTRKISVADQVTNSGKWGLEDVVPIHRLKSRVLGLVGFGKIPQALAPKAQALGLEVIAHDPYVSTSTPTSLGVKLVKFHDLLREADILSLHAPLTQETHHMFDRKAFGLIRQGAFLINTARGPLIDTPALVEALDTERLAGAALDVLEEEPPPPDSPLVGRGNVIITPHTGFYSEEALLELQTKAVEDVVRVLDLRPPLYPINPEVLSDNRIA